MLTWKKSPVTWKKVLEWQAQINSNPGPPGFHSNARSRTCRPGAQNEPKSAPQMVPSESPKSSKTLCSHCLFALLASQDGPHFGGPFWSILGAHGQAAASQFRPKWLNILAKGWVWHAHPNTLFHVNYFSFMSITSFHVDMKKGLHLSKLF